MCKFVASKDHCERWSVRKNISMQPSKMFNHDVQLYISVNSMQSMLDHLRFMQLSQDIMTIEKVVNTGVLIKVKS